MKNFHKLFTEHFNIPVGSVLEIGSRDGHDAEKLRALSNLIPQMVYIVEPHPESAKKIRLAYPDFHVYELAVYNQAGVIPFNAIPHFFNEGFVGTSSLFNIRDEVVKTQKRVIYNNWIKVLAVTGQMLLQLIDLPTIDLVKIDVEGATYEVLESFGADLRLLKALHLEFETQKIWDTPHSIDEAYKLLQFYNFKEVFRAEPYSMQRDSIWMRMD